MSGCFLSHERPEEEVRPPLEGPRLRLVELVTDEGLAQPAGYYDALLDIDCEFGFDERGDIRCLPTELGFPAYLDDACTEPWIDVGDSREGRACEPLPFVRLDSCLGGKVYETTRRRTRAGQEWQPYAGGCRSRGPFPQEEEFAGLRHVDPSRFLKGELQPVPDGTGVVPILLETEEGMTLPSGMFFDRDRGVPCDLVLDHSVGEGRAFCVAVAPGGLTGTGAQCSGDAFRVDFGACLADDGGLHVLAEGDACGHIRREVVEVGDTSAIIQSCIFPGDFQGRNLVPVAESRYATLDARLVGDGPVQRVELQSGAESFSLGEPSFWNQVNGERCFPRIIGSTFHCIPGGRLAIWFGPGRPTSFGDPGCEVPAPTPSPLPPCGELEEYYGFIGSCPRDQLLVVYAREEEVDRWYDDRDGTCREFIGGPGDTRTPLREMTFPGLRRVVR